MKKANRQAIIGAASYIPLVNHYLNRKVTGSGGTSSARYCYSVWLRHLVQAGKRQLFDSYPRTIAELGPGASLGTGLAALISGCDQYLALDVRTYANPETNLRVFDELVALFRNRESIPDQSEFREIRPVLPDYGFPHAILDAEHMARVLAEPRITRIRNSLHESSGQESVLAYKAPWYDANVIQEHAVDMIFSQAVLEHVEDLVKVYHAMKLWLKPAGFMSHQIDFRCHDTADEWNGHWAISDFKWKLIVRRPLGWPNREPHSRHIEVLHEQGFTIVCDLVEQTPSTLSRDELAPRFRTMSAADLMSSGAFIQAKACD